MDEVTLTRVQLKKLSQLDQDVVITAVNGDAGLIFFETVKQRGFGKGKWMRPDGRLRDDSGT